MSSSETIESSETRQSSETTASNFEIIYENYIFTFISKFTTVQDYQLVFLISTKLIDSIKSTDPVDIKELIFARSKSECGFWRLCIAKPESVGNNFYLEKGPQYTMSTFIIIELQLYLDSILDDLPIDESPHEDKRFCQQNFFEIYDAINNRPRMINNDEFGLDLNFNILKFRDEHLINTDSISFIGDYNYEGKLNNFYQISKRDIDVKEKMMAHHTEMNLERKAVLEEELKTIWPSRFNDVSDIGDYQDINYGITDISIHGKIYSIEFKDRNYKLYYMIYNCKIVAPEENINKYQDGEINLEYRAESVEATQLIIPIYIIPKGPLVGFERYGTGGLRRDRFTMYGLYNYYINSKYNGKDLKTSKFLDYIQQCRSPSEAKKPTCTTKYKFMGYYFDAIPFFSMIKSKTLEKFPPIVESVGGKQKKNKKSNKTKKNKKNKKSNKNKKNKKTKKYKKSKK
jgi:hypothetical protein